MTKPQPGKSMSILPWLITYAAFICVTATVVEPVAGFAYKMQILPLLTRHCLSCHGKIKKNGFLRCRRASGVECLADRDFGEGPPRRCAADHSQQLNLGEYGDTLRDLSGLDLAFRQDFPPDGLSGEGFRSV